MIELRHLHYVTGLAKTMNFTAAAKEMHIAQPALSQNIQQVEDELGIKLFERNSRGVRLTKAGTVFCSEALRTLEQLDRTKQLSVSTARGEGGELSMGVTTTTLLGHLPQRISKYRQMYPKVQLNLKERLVDVLTTSLAMGEFDLICTDGHILDDRFDSVALPPVPVVVGIHCDNPLGRESTPIELKELANETFISPTPYKMHSIHYAFLNACRAAGFEPKQSYYADTAAGAIGYVASNLGVGLMPRLLIIAPTSSVVWRKIINPSLDFRMQLISRRGDVSIQAQNFLRCAD